VHRRGIPGDLADWLGKDSQIGNCLEKDTFRELPRDTLRPSRLLFMERYFKDDGLREHSLHGLGVQVHIEILLSCLRRATVRKTLKSSKLLFKQRHFKGKSQGCTLRSR